VESYAFEDPPESLLRVAFIAFFGRTEPVMPLGLFGTEASVHRAKAEQVCCSGEASDEILAVEDVALRIEGG